MTPQGKRFTNEGNSYHDFVQAMIKACRDEREVSAWLLCDHKALRSQALGCVAPAPLPIGRHLRSGYLKRGATLAELARLIEKRLMQPFPELSPGSAAAVPIRRHRPSRLEPLQKGARVQ